MDDNTVECPRCGRVFSLEHTRCPQCGLNIYPEDEADGGIPGLADQAEEQAGAWGWFWTVVLGWILAGTVSFAVHMFASQAGSAETLSHGWKVALFFSGPLGALVGGYAAAGMAQRGRWRAAGLGALVGLGAAALVVLFEMRWRLVTPHVILETPMLTIYALCLGLGAAGAWMKAASLVETATYPAASAGERDAPVQKMSWEDLLYRDLLTRVRYNRDTAERLIEYERRLAPEADRYTLIRNAVDRLDRDRGQG